MAQVEDQALSLMDQLDDAADDVASGRIVYGDHHCTIMCYEDNLEKLNESVAIIDSTLRDVGLIMKKEDLNKEPGFWYNCLVTIFILLAQLEGVFYQFCRLLGFS